MDMLITSLTVRGESGIEYTVTTDANGSAHCTCPSFRYRTRWCKHLEFVTNVLKVGVAV